MEVDTKRVRGFLDVDSLRLTIHGEAFYGTNREHIETIRITETTGMAMHRKGGGRISM